MWGAETVSLGSINVHLGQSCNEGGPPHNHHDLEGDRVYDKPDGRLNFV